MISALQDTGHVGPVSDTRIYVCPALSVLGQSQNTAPTRVTSSLMQLSLTYLTYQSVENACMQVFPMGTRGLDPQYI